MRLRDLAGWALALLAPAVAGADWLVLRDGARIETRGPTKNDGRRVTFTDPRGHLVTLAASEVDLVATAAANRAPAVARAGNAAGAAPEKRVAVRRFTDADFAHADDAEEPSIALYTTSWCGWCRRSRELLEELGARYHEMDVERDAAADLEKERLAPGSGVPVLAFEETVLTGYTERGIRRMVEAWRAADRVAAEAHEASRRPALGATKP